MNRKLHNTILAFSVTGVMLFVGLVVAEPVLSEQDAVPLDTPALVVEDTLFEQTLDATIDATIEARVRQLDASLAEASDPAEALAMSAGLVAATATEVALQAALSELRKEFATGEHAPQANIETPRAARRGGGSRDVIAVPYFSFARGSRGSRS
ncbi:hypothetical protein E2F46_13570 [Luteimonas aestuarii]|uniref:Uncharacterized protein n=1 Tax=Luteimonas aestuarii TaxID=453837 RepID=A0A4R5TT24_9GAMM|nr:hypothetical protein [Luteimonas aestuarii]TDK22489.1 hypothetical protein E2F46_13570 [Luteimonas aestuarii]